MANAVVSRHQLRHLLEAGYQNSNEDEGGHGGYQFGTETRECRGSFLQLEGQICLVIRCDNDRVCCLCGHMRPRLECYKALGLSTVRCKRQAECKIPLHLRQILFPSFMGCKMQLVHRSQKVFLPTAEFASMAGPCNTRDSHGEHMTNTV